MNSFLTQGSPVLSVILNLVARTFHENLLIRPARRKSDCLTSTHCNSYTPQNQLECLRPLAFPKYFRTTHDLGNLQHKPSDHFASVFQTNGSGVPNHVPCLLQALLSRQNPPLRSCNR